MGVDDHGLGDQVLDVSEGLKPDTLGEAAGLLHYWSAHAGGANFALCDGSVRYISYSIDEATFLALGSARGGGSEWVLAMTEHAFVVGNDANRLKNP